MLGNKNIYISINDLNLINYYKKIGFYEIDKYSLGNENYMILKYKKKIIK